MVAVGTASQSDTATRADPAADGLAVGVSFFGYGTPPRAQTPWVEPIAGAAALCRGLSRCGGEGVYATFSETQQCLVAFVDVVGVHAALGEAV